jgi:dTDP-4-amino-4,6-dideoxygalactose transaminase
MDLFMDQIPQAKPEMDQEMIGAATLALQNERLVMGESVFKFEEAFAKYIGVKRAVSISSGTDALILALMAIDCRGKEVITTPFSFIATANSVVHAGGRPRFCDVKREDRNLDMGQVASAVDDGTRAVLPVHIFGHPCDMSPLMDLAEEKDLKVVEDACQAHGAAYRGRKVGSWGHVGCFSFYPTKNMSVGGDGGMVTTDDEELASSIAKLRDCGRTSRYSHDVIGFTSRLNTVNAAIGLVQLKRLDAWNQRRVDVAQRYTRRLKDVSGLGLPPRGSAVVSPVFHLYAVESDGREQLAERLQQEGIATAVHYPIPIHLQPAYRTPGADGEGAYPVSESLSKRMLSLPMFPSIRDEQVDRVCEAVVKHFG